MRLPVLLSGRMLRRSDAAIVQRLNRAISPIADHLKTRLTAIHLNPRSVQPDNAGRRPNGKVRQIKIVCSYQRCREQRLHWKEPTEQLSSVTSKPPYNPTVNRCLVG